jgi:NAD+ diphosphatase
MWMVLSRATTVSEVRPRRRSAPPLSRSTLDRAAQLRTDDVWLAEAWQRSRVLVIHDGKALVAGDHLILISPAAAPPGDRLFLGVDPSGVPYFAVVAPLPPTRANDLARPYGIREVGHILSDFEAGLLMTSVALANWHARHEFSPVTGAPTAMRDGGWVRADESGAQMWPRTDPAVIVLVHDGEPGEDGCCLLGSNVAWSRGRVGELPRYSCLAGFVEPGESAEQTVLREVLEEVGVHVSHLRYVASQPWPYPGSLMLGFLALGDPDEQLAPDPAEISDARWFTRTEIRAAASGDPDVGFGIPMQSSIAHFLIMKWLDDTP